MRLIGARGPGHAYIVSNTHLSIDNGMSQDNSRNSENSADPSLNPSRQRLERLGIEIVQPESTDVTHVVFYGPKVRSNPDQGSLPGADVDHHRHPNGGSEAGEDA
jgi:hypothetical protein